MEKPEIYENFIKKLLYIIDLFKIKMQEKLENILFEE